MKLKLYILLCCLAQVCAVWGQEIFRGRVTDVSHKPLADVTVYAVVAQKGIKTLPDGSFSIQLAVNDTLRFSALGFKKLQVPVSGSKERIFILETVQHKLDAVTVQTGYYGIAKERSTGAFAFVDSALFNRSVSSDVISRLEGVINGLNFDRRGSFYADDNPSIQVRGLSTINANTEPLNH